MLRSYLRKQYPKGRIRSALKTHVCNGSIDGKDPGCGGPISKLDSYFDTGLRDEFFQAGRFCKYRAGVQWLTLYERRFHNAVVYLVSFHLESFTGLVARYYLLMGKPHGD